MGRRLGSLGLGLVRRQFALQRLAVRGDVDVRLATDRELQKFAALDPSLFSRRWPLVLRPRPTQKPKYAAHDLDHADEGSHHVGRRNADPRKAARPHHGGKQALLNPLFEEHQPHAQANEDHRAKGLRRSYLTPRYLLANHLIDPLAPERTIARPGVNPPEPPVHLEAKRMNPWC